MKAIVFLILFVLTIGTSAQRYRVVISELMADPTPTAGLPEYEWVELYNRSGSPVNLAGWRIGDETARSGPLPAFILEPDSLVVIAGATASTHLSHFARCLPVTAWPSLDNAGDHVVLYDNYGEIVHAVAYESTWYGNAVKAEGGWSLEMLWPEYPCLSGSNWAASGAAGGGSPGRAALPATQRIPETLMVRNCYMLAPNILTLEFSHALSETEAGNPTHYNLFNGPAVQSVKILPPFFNRVELLLTHAADAGVVYNITVTGIRDCTGAVVKTDTLQWGLPGDPAKADIVINEILFNPLPDGSDYLELYNRSSRIIDARSLRIAARNGSGQLQSITAIAQTPDLILPGQYRVYTTDTAWLHRQYPPAPQKQVRPVASFPSYPDREGVAVLLTITGDVLDELRYHENWHFPLLASGEGVALERIDAGAATDDAANWHSAAGSSGFGTPGYKNSQSRLPAARSPQAFSVPARRLSPDNDGVNDRLYIHYSMQEAGVVANIRIFDSRGQPVRILERNILLGRSGQFAWDGLDDQQRPLMPGIYIIWVEWFDLRGNRNIWKEGIVLEK